MDVVYVRDLFFHVRQSTTRTSPVKRSSVGLVLVFTVDYGYGGCLVERGRDDYYYALLVCGGCELDVAVLRVMHLVVSP